jgi:hypothetical protein
VRAPDRRVPCESRAERSNEREGETELLRSMNARERETQWAETEKVMVCVDGSRSVRFGRQYIVTPCAILMVYKNKSKDNHSDGHWLVMRNTDIRDCVTLTQTHAPVSILRAARPPLRIRVPSPPRARGIRRSSRVRGAQSSRKKSALARAQSVALENVGMRAIMDATEYISVETIFSDHLFLKPE